MYTKNQTGSLFFNMGLSNIRLVTWVDVISGYFRHRRNAIYFSKFCVELRKSIFDFGAAFTSQSNKLVRQN